MLILVRFRLDSSIWMLDVSPMPGVYGSSGGSSGGWKSSAATLADARTPNWIFEIEVTKSYDTFYRLLGEEIKAAGLMRAC